MEPARRRRSRMVGTTLPWMSLNWGKHFKHHGRSVGDPVKGAGVVRPAAVLGLAKEAVRRGSRPNAHVHLLGLWRCKYSELCEARRQRDVFSQPPPPPPATSHTTSRPKNFLEPAEELLGAEEILSHPDKLYNLVGLARRSSP